MSAKMIILQSKHYCMHKRILCLRSIDGNSVVHSWVRSAMNGPIKRLNKIFFSSKSYLLDVRNLGNRDR
jgi:hypothetical protein